MSTSQWNKDVTDRITAFVEARWNPALKWPSTSWFQCLEKCSIPLDITAVCGVTPGFNLSSTRTLGNQMTKQRPWHAATPQIRFQVNA
jgi:hypothetical protein